MSFMFFKEWVRPFSSYLDYHIIEQPPRRYHLEKIKKKRVRSFSLIISLGGEKTPNPNEDAKALIPMGMSPSKLGLSCGLLIVKYEVAEQNL